MEGLMNWVRQIVFFMIFMSVFNQFIPDKKYKGYLKLFASLVLILLTMNPLAELFDFQRQLDFNQDVFAYPREVEEFRLKAEQVQGQQYEDVLENYQQTVEEQLERMAGRFGMYVSGCSIELSGETESFGQVTMVRLTVSYRKTDAGSEETGSMMEIEPVRISPIQAETAVPEAEVSEAVRSETPMSETAPSRFDLGENQDVADLKEQILQLYQLNPEQVAIELEI